MDVHLELPKNTLCKIEIIFALILMVWLTISPIEILYYAFTIVTLSSLRHYKDVMAASHLLAQFGCLAFNPIAITFDLTI